MGQTSYSSTSFWAKQIAIAVVIIIAAGVLIYVLQIREDSPVAESQKTEKSISRGLSEFYRDFRQSSTDPLEDEQSDFVLDVAGVDPNLDQTLSQMSSRTRPVDKNWSGEHKYRTFSEGNTLRGAISQYAQAEGMQVIWNLEQDFVIKYQFQLENTVAGSLTQIARAIDSNFERPIKTYLCAEQRSLVVTERETDFLAGNCKRLGG